MDESSVDVELEESANTNSRQDKPMPMAFTVDLGEDSPNEKRRLALRDGIKHFAPRKPAFRLGSAHSSHAPDVNANTSPIMTNAKAAAKIATVAPSKERRSAPTPSPPPPPPPTSRPPKSDAGSDTGTYTIEDEQGNEGDRDDDDDDAYSERQKISSVFGVEASEMASSEWVAAWAASPHPPSTSPSADRDDMTRSSSRRRLPATPDIIRRTSNSTTPVASNKKTPTATGSGSKLMTSPLVDTEEYLQETVSVMAAMEARIKSVNAQENNGTRAKSNLTKHALDSVTPNRFDTNVIRENVPSGGATSRPTSGKFLPATRPNRAFALRRQLNSSLDESVTVTQKLTTTEETTTTTALSRTDGGRFSMRSKKAAQASPGPVTEGKKLLRETAAPEGRSSSSLSSREAEFQAWKRRKNYNPMRSAIADRVSKATPRKNPHAMDPAKASGVANKNMHRSASFHYEEGPLHSSPSEEEESAPEDGITNRLLEVDDDEFILPIQNLRRPLNTGPSSLASSASVSTSATLSSIPAHGRQSNSSGCWEAIDNLVISTIFSVSTKLCLHSAALLRLAQERTENEEQLSLMDTLLYVLDDTDLPASPSRKTSKELAGTLRNLKKVEQTLQVLERSYLEDSYADEHNDM